MINFHNFHDDVRKIKYKDLGTKFTNCLLLKFTKAIDSD